MRNGILNKDSVSLSGGTKTKQPGGNVRILKRRRSFGSRNSLVRKDKVMHRCSGGLLWYRGSREVVEAAVQSSSCLLPGDGRGRSLSTKEYLTRAQGKFRSGEEQAERCVCVYCVMWLCVSLVVIKVKNGCLRRFAKSVHYLMQLRGILER